MTAADEICAAEMNAPAKDLGEGSGRETSSAYSTASRDFDDALRIIAERLLLKPTLQRNPYAIAAKFPQIIASLIYSLSDARHAAAAKISTVDANVGQQ